MRREKQNEKAQEEEESVKKLHDQSEWSMPITLRKNIGRKARLVVSTVGFSSINELKHEEIPFNTGRRKWGYPEEEEKEEENDTSDSENESNDIDGEVKSKTFLDNMWRNKNKEDKQKLQSLKSISNSGVLKRQRPNDEGRNKKKRKFK